MTTLEDSITYYEKQVLKIRKDADDKVKVLESHIKALKKRLANQKPPA